MKIDDELAKTIIRQVDPGNDEASYYSYMQYICNPLTTNCSCSSYWSNEERDRIFGANTDPYAQRWGGSL